MIEESFLKENENGVQRDELKEYLRIYSELCVYSSLLFRYPSVEVYKSLLDYFEQFKSFLLDFGLAIPDVPSREELEVEYVRLFIANYGGVIAPLYSSVYTSEEKLILRDSTIKLRDMMREEGFVLRDEIKDVEDNLYILFEFVGILLSNSLDIDLYKMDVAKKVIKGYIFPMMDEFVEKVVNNSRLDFYRVASQFAANLVNDLVEFLDFCHGKNIV